MAAFGSGADFGQGPGSGTGRSNGRSNGLSSGRGTAVVIGGSVAGLLAAWARRCQAERVLIVERDRYPDDDAPEHRAGVPQSRHGHLLLEAGQRAVEQLMPGVCAELTAAGAIRIAMPCDLRWLTAAGWLPDFDSDLGFIFCTRPLLDAALLRRVRTEPSIEILEAREAVGLLGDARTITGVRVRERGTPDAAVHEIHAELVVEQADAPRPSPRGWPPSAPRPRRKSAWTRACPTPAASTVAPTGTTATTTPTPRPGQARTASTCRPKPPTTHAWASCCPPREGIGS
jgi:hypothetical protein